VDCRQENCAITASWLGRPGTPVDAGVAAHGAFVTVCYCPFFQRSHKLAAAHINH
jgi:hypothetical protein